MILKTIPNLVKRHIAVLVYYLDPLTTARSAPFQKPKVGSLHFTFAAVVLLFSYLYGILYFVLYLDHFDGDHLKRWHHSIHKDRQLSATSQLSASLCPVNMYHQAFPPPIWAQADVLFSTAAATAVVVLATLLYSSVNGVKSAHTLSRYTVVQLNSNNNKKIAKITPSNQSTVDQGSNW